jgi:hypothetical protein
MPAVGDGIDAPPAPAGPTTRNLRGVLQAPSFTDNQLMLERAEFGEIVRVYRWMGWEKPLAWA